MAGQVTSEGDRAIQSDIARLLFGVSGSGIKVGVISESFNTIATGGVTLEEAVANGEFPGEGNPDGFTQSVQVLRDPEFGFGTGNSLLQIVHDVAPGAELLFYAIEANLDDFTNQDITDQSIADAINALVEAGANVILVNQEGAIPVPMFQDGVAAQAIDAAAQKGVIVVTPSDSIGNSYESELRLSETFSFRGNTYQAHDFDLGEEVDLFQTIEFNDNDELELLLNWQQASGQVKSDFEIFLMDRPELPGAGGRIIAKSGIAGPDSQNNTTNDPTRILKYDSSRPEIAYLVIAKKQDAKTPDPERIKWINIDGINPLVDTANDITYEYVNDQPEAESAATVFGIPNAEGVITVGAADFANTPAYGSELPVQADDYFSKGSSPILFDPEGNPLSTPKQRSKPDVIGPTRVASTAVVYEDFPTASTAAAHVAGTIALMLERAGGASSLSLEQVRNLLKATALPVAPQPNLPEDAGFIQADAAVTLSYIAQQIGTLENDVLQATDAASNLVGLAGSDRLRGGQGSDALLGGEGNDTLEGKWGNDYLLGEQGDDTLLGDSSDDFLSGGSGTNHLTGGEGADKFLLDAEGTANIRDFQKDEDTLVLPVGIQFSDLELIQQGHNAVIQLSGDTLAVLSNIDTDTIVADTFFLLPDIQQETEPVQLSENEGENEGGTDGDGSEPFQTPEEAIVEQVRSEGDRAARADVARRLFGLDGAGIKIGIISDSFDNFLVDEFLTASDEVQSGELPGQGNPDGYTQPVQVLREAAGLNEGRAMAQIIYDLAPGAELLFHTVFNQDLGEGEGESFAIAINALVAAGADIIVDDVGTTANLFFEDSTVAQAVNQAAKQGITYITSAGNQGTLSYESEFRLSTTFSYRGSQYQAHDFDVSAGIDLFQDIQTPDVSAIDLLMNWQQSAGQVQTDYELFLLDQPILPGEGSQILATADIPALDATDAPAQSLSYLNTQQGTVYLMIARKQGASPSKPSPESNPAPEQIKWINFGGDPSSIYQYVNDSASSTAATVFGQANAMGAIAVGAADFAKTPAYGVSPVIIEDYSASGGSPIYFDPDGNPLPVAEQRDKPEVIAPTRVATSVPLFEEFSGTSAAAPHIAAVAALMLERAGGSKSLTPEQIRTLLQETAFPVAPQPNLPKNTGFVQADAAVTQAFTAEQTGTSRSDTLQGTDASENLYGLGDNDQLLGGQGLDALYGGDGDDTLEGGQDNDYLLGDRGDDVLVGSIGQDFLAGGRGQNRLTGGEAADIFLLDLNGTAILEDFQKGEDLIALPATLQFSNLTFIPQDQNTLIRFSNTDLATLTETTTAALTVADFVLA